MKNIFSRRGLFLGSVAVVVLSNIVVLSGISFNRSGDPESAVELTERELQLPYYFQKENSGLALRLDWSSSESELNAEKLKSIGFDIDDRAIADEDFTEQGMRFLPKEVFVVLEYDGGAHQAYLARLEKELQESKQSDPNINNKLRKLDPKWFEQRLKRAQNSDSRLYAIDIGTDPVELRSRYADRSRYIIAKGLVSVSPDYGTKKFTGRISELSVDEIHVPIEHRKIFEPMMTENARDASAEPDDPRLPRYKVKLAYGSRHEPWIQSVSTMNNQAALHTDVRHK